MFDFGKRLRELREQHHLSQEAMGKIIGRSKPVISSYENNLKLPTLDVLMSIAALYNVSLDYLVGFEKKEMVSVEGLTESQKGIIHSLVFEFHDPKQEAVGFSERQQAIMSELMKEFSKKR